MRPLITPSAIRLMAIRTEPITSNAAGRAAAAEAAGTEPGPDRWIATLRTRLRLRRRVTEPEALHSHAQLAERSQGWEP